MGMDIILPIFNLTKHRFNNFCFVVSELSRLKLDVVVCEQESENTTHTEKYLLKASNVSHKVFPSPSHTFNKSRLINQGVSDSSTPLVWLLDCDVYLNYNFVINNIPSGCDFIRPFKQMIMLNEKETFHLFETNKLGMSDREYETNECDGKFSFIVSKQLFSEVGGFNEDFQGWGYQDLDFINKLPESASKCHLSNTGFHLYHEPASRKLVTHNRSLYFNYGGTDKIAKKYENNEYNSQPNSQPEPSTQNLVVSQPTPTPTPTPIPRVVKRIKRPVPWKKPTNVFFQKTIKHSLFYGEVKHRVGPALSTQDDSRDLSYGRTISGTLKINRDTTHYLYRCFAYIVKTYESMSGVTMFIHDTSDSTLAKQIISRLDEINSGTYEAQSSLGFSKLSSTGNFIVTTKQIHSHPKNYYEYITGKMRGWKLSDYKAYQESLPDVFT